MEKDEPHLRQPVPEVEDTPPPSVEAVEPEVRPSEKSKRHYWAVGGLVLALVAGAGILLLRRSDIRVHRSTEDPEVETPVVSSTPGESIERLQKDLAAMDQKLTARDGAMAEALSDLKRAVTHRGAFPRVSVMDESERFVLTAEMPGFERDQIDIDVEASSVQIKGVRKLDLPGKPVLSERVDDHFERSLPLPSPVEPAKANAYYRDGLLTIELPKAASDIRKVSPDVQP